MKKYLFFILILVVIEANAQVELGFKFAPIISGNRVKDTNKLLEKDQSKLKFSVGFIVDKPLTDNYYLSTGLIYIPKYISFKGSTIIEQYQLQYLQIPVTIKLFTNEIAPDLKMFFQVGTGFEIKIYEENEDVAFTTIEKFNPFDISLILGTGIEYRLGISTIIFGGVSYQRALLNVVNQSNNMFSGVDIRTTIFSFDFGIKF